MIQQAANTPYAYLYNVPDYVKMPDEAYRFDPLRKNIFISTIQ